MADNKTVVEEARKRFNLAYEAWEKQYKLSQKDLKFCSTDSQWPEEVKQARAGRPTYASDRINSQVKSIVNAQRENRPAVRVHPANDGADEDTAEVIQGIVRHIENDSDADLAYDQAFEDTVRCGIGFWRIITEYEEEGFDQNIKIDSLINPFQVYLDPGFKKLDGSDINWCFIIDTMSEEEYKDLYPNSELSSYNSSAWMGLNQRIPDWFSNNGKVATVAEYFVKEDQEEVIVKLADGRILPKKQLLPEEKAMIVLERTTTKPVVKWYKINGVEVLEETTWPGNRIPLVPVFGDALLEDGQRIYSGLVRKVMEEQMMLNVAKTTAIELIAATPKAPWVGPLGFVGNRKADWQDVNLKNLAYLEYDILDDMGNPLPAPTRNVQEPPIQGILEIMNSIEMDIKSTNNMFDPSMGQKVNNQSGKAVLALQNAGSVGNYHFSDNLSRAIRLCGRILLDLIPKIYNEKRVIRIIGNDDKHKLMTINGEGNPDETGIEADLEGIAPIYDVTTGKYDITVASGPSYQTKRQENLSMLFDLAGKDPQLMGIAGDLIVSQIDSPMSEQLTRRLEKALPPGLLDDSNEKLPPSVIQRLQQDQQMIQQLTEALQKETALADKVQQSENTKLQIAQMQINLELMKQKSQMEHETNTLSFAEELKALNAKNKMTHDMVMSIQKHALDKDRMETEAELKNHEHIVKGVVDGITQENATKVKED